MRPDLANYETVDTRIHRFYEANPDGRIATDLIAYSETSFIVRAEVYADRGDTLPIASGYAEERVGSSPVNKTSALENCETSAIGRALANAGFSTKGARPSREEMTKADRIADSTPRPIASPLDIDRFAAAIVIASTPEQLAAVGAEIQGFTMRDEERATLRSLYLERKAEIATPAEEVEPA